jgi:hypothetical protein
MAFILLIRLLVPPVYTAHKLKEEIKKTLKIN